MGNREFIRNYLTDMTRVIGDFSKESAFLDGEYYCFHHPEAKLEELKINCECRKPEPGLLLQAASEMGIDLPQSWMIGDGLTDIIVASLPDAVTQIEKELIGK